MEILSTVSFDSALSLLSFVGVMLTLFVTGCWSFFIDQLIDGDDWTPVYPDITVKEQRVQFMRSLINDKWIFELSLDVPVLDYEVVDFKSYTEIGFSLPSPEEMELEHDMQDGAIDEDLAERWYADLDRDGWGDPMIWLMTLVNLEEIAGPEFKISVVVSDTWVYDYRNFFTECAQAEKWEAEYEKAMEEAVIEM